MALLLETTVGDLVIDLDVEGSPELSRNFLKLAKARYFSSSLIYNVQPHRYCQLGDPQGSGSGGTCIYGLLDTNSVEITTSKARFLKSKGRVLTRTECQERARVVATEMNGIRDTIGSQFLITLEGGEGRALDGYLPEHMHNTDNGDASKPTYLSLGVVTEDDNGVLEKIHNAYCDANGRPYADIRIERALIIHDPFEDPPGMKELLEKRGVIMNETDNTVTASPSYERPPEETVEVRISANQIDEQEDEEEDTERARLREEEIQQKEDKSRAVVLEMLGDLPSADIKAPENVLFVCKLNAITQDEDLELIFSRFDPSVKVEIIRDYETGASLQYAFCEFTTKKQCVEAYFKMNGALIDDRRIKVDFSQSVAKIWDRYNQKLKPEKLDASNMQHSRGPSGGQHRGGRGGGRGGGGRGGNYGQNGGGGKGGRGSQYRNDRGRGGGPPREDRGRRPEHPVPRGRDEQYSHEPNHRHDDRRDRHRDASRGRYKDDYQMERRHRRDDHSPRREYDEEYDRRRRRSRSPSPGTERSRDRKTGRHHSRKRDRRERSHSRSDDYQRKHRDDEGRPSPRRCDSENGGRSEREDGEESHSKHRGEDDDDRGRRHDRHDDERRRRKKHHRHGHRDRDDRDDRRHKKPKHKGRRRRSRSRSAS